MSDRIQHLQNIAEDAMAAAGQCMHDVNTDALRAAVTAVAEALRPAAQPAVPAGWQLVPVEPTMEMIEAGESVSPEDHWVVDVAASMPGSRQRTRPVDSVLHWQAMLSAAPAAQPVGEPVAPKLIGWRTENFLWETDDADKARNWEPNIGVLPIFEGDPNTKLCTTPQPFPDGGWREDFDLAAQMLTWGREEGLTDAQAKEIDAHAKKMFARLAVTPQPLPEHADHVPEIAARLRLVAKLAGVPDAVPADDITAVGCIFSVLGNMRFKLERLPKPAPATDAARDVLAERQRQIEAEGWTPEHDDVHEIAELAYAAACYTLADLEVFTDTPHAFWPWAPEWWKPRDRRRNLIKAGALLLAEIERLDRAAKKGAQP